MNHNHESVNECMAASDRPKPYAEVIWHYPISLFEPTYLVLPKGANFIDVVTRPETSQPHLYVLQKNTVVWTAQQRDFYSRNPNNFDLWEIRAYRAGMQVAVDGPPNIKVGTVIARDGLCKSFIFARLLGRPPFAQA